VSKQKIQPGLALDFLTPEEFISGMDNHAGMLLKALGKNAIFRRHIIASACDATGNIRAVATPPDGFLWCVMAVNANASGGQAGNLNMYINDNNNQVNIIGIVATAANPTPLFFSNKQFILHSADTVIITNQAAYAANTQISVMFHCIEVPNSHEAQLLL